MTKDQFVAWALNNLNEKAIERSKALSKLQKENDELKQKIKSMNNT